MSWIGKLSETLKNGNVMIYSIYNQLKLKESVSDTSYTHLTKTGLVFIEEYHEIGLKGRKIADKLGVTAMKQFIALSDS